MDINTDLWTASVRRTNKPYQAFSTLLGILGLFGLFLFTWKVRSRRATSKQGILLRYAEPLMVFAAGILVTFLLAYTADIHERLDRRETFTRLASKRISIIRDTLSDIRNFHLEGLARFFEGSEIVSPSEFETFTEHLSREEAVRAWAWIPVVPHGERDHFELLMGTTGSSSPVFTEKGEEGLLKAGERDFFYPVLYLTPLHGNEVLQGFDLGSDPVLLEALTAGSGQDCFSVAGPVRLFADEGSKGELLFLRPIYSEGQNGTSGFVMAICSPEKTLLLCSGKGSLTDFSYLDLQLLLLEDDGKEVFLASTEGPGLVRMEEHTLSSLEGGFEQAVPIFAMGKTFVATATPNEAFSDLYPRRAGWITAIAGILVALTLFFASLTEVRRRTGLEEKVRERSLALAQSEHRYRSLFENSHSVMLIIDPTDGSIIDANPAAELFYGWPREEIIRMKISSINTLSPEEVQEEMGKARKKGTTRLFFQHRLSNGSVREVEVFSGPIMIDNKALLFSIVHDITDRRVAERALEESENRYDSFINTHRDIIFVKDDQLRYVVVNEAAKRFFGREREEILGLTDSELMDPADARHCYESDMKALMKGSAITIEERVGNRVFETTKFPLPLEDKKVGIGAIIRDVADEKAFEDQLHHLATHDTLTGLTNRTLLLDRLEQALQFASRSGRPLAVLLINLDRFRMINDSLGSTVGDGLLMAVASRLVESVREGDAVARMGGDNFAILLTSMARQADALAVGAKILDQLSLPFSVLGRKIRISASIGVSVFPGEGKDPETLVKHAELAMFEAKKVGGKSLKAFETGMDTRMTESHLLEDGLHSALERTEFVLFYQPQVDIKTGRITGAEALIRWQHPERGLLPPGSFIPIAEETDLIVRIGEWVLREACEQASKWTAIGLPPILVSANISARQFREKGLLEKMQKTIKRSGVNPGRICLELTESVLMEDPFAAIETIRSLKETGICLALDDFGTGFSSLNYLRRFPVDTLKIDRSFISDLLTDPGAAGVINSVISLARHLGLMTLAEGVETREQLEMLSRWGCDSYQGFLCSRPVPAGEFEQLLRKDGNPL